MQTSVCESNHRNKEWTFTNESIPDSSLESIMDKEKVEYNLILSSIKNDGESFIHVTDVVSYYQENTPYGKENVLDCCIPYTTIQTWGILVDNIDEDIRNIVSRMKKMNDVEPVVGCILYYLGH